MCRGSMEGMGGFRNKARETRGIWCFVIQGLGIWGVEVCFSMGSTKGPRI